MTADRIKKLGETEAFALAFILLCLALQIY